MADLDDAARAGPEATAAVWSGGRRCWRRATSPIGPGRPRPGDRHRRPRPSAYVERAVLDSPARRTRRPGRISTTRRRSARATSSSPSSGGRSCLEKKERRGLRGVREGPEGRPVAARRVPRAGLGLPDARVRPRAQAILDDAVPADPDNPEAYGNRATLHLARGDYENALFNFGEVTRLSPGSARAYNELARGSCDLPGREVPRRPPGRGIGHAQPASSPAGRIRGTWRRSPRPTPSPANSAPAVQSQERALSLLAAKAPEKAEYQRLLDRVSGRSRITR